jgi:multiple antibiotic resistance protein
MKIPVITNYFISLFMLCSPLTAIPVFLNLTLGRQKEVRRRIAIILGVAVGLILIITTWIGGFLLEVLGIRIPAFQCAGGIIVFLLALSMLNAQMSPMRQTEHEENAKGVIPIVPLAIPVMAGPGALSGVIVVANTYHAFSDLVILSLCAALVGVATAIILYFGVQLEKKLGPTGLNVVTRIGGLILAALAVEIFVRGIEGIYAISFNP